MDSDDRSASYYAMGNDGPSAAAKQGHSVIQSQTTEERSTAYFELTDNGTTVSEKQVSTQTEEQVENVSMAPLPDMEMAPAPAAALATVPAAMAAAATATAAVAAATPGPVATAVNPHIFNKTNAANASLLESKPRRERRCTDVLWALLFWAHLAGVGYTTYMFTPIMMKEISSAKENDDYFSNWGQDAQDEQAQDAQGGRHLASLVMTRILSYSYDDYHNNVNQNNARGDIDYEDIDWSVNPFDLLYLIGTAAGLSLVLSSLAMTVMMCLASFLIKICLVFTIVLFFSLGVASFWMELVVLTIISFIIVGFTIFYTSRVWPRIPFAAANLCTAVTAVQDNGCLAFYAYNSVFLNFIWALWWALASASTMFVLSGCNGFGECQKSLNGGYIFLSLFSYYWTSQIISNVVHFTTAGTVATWWFEPRMADGCCSPAISESYCRATTFNFGSICFASLIVGIVQAIRETFQSMKDNCDSFVACIADCCLDCLEMVLETFNRYALVYCAVRGQNFLQSGKSVMELFRARGWTSIITDMLIDTALFMVAFGVAILVGTISVVIGAYFDMQSTGTLSVAFFAGAILGFSISSILFSVVSSAVNTVIVLFAESPNEFQSNHPELSSHMRNSWRQAWPAEFSY